MYLRNKMNNFLPTSEANYPPKKLIQNVTDKLCTPESYSSLAHKAFHNVPMPWINGLKNIVEQIRSVLFPGYYGASELNTETMNYYTGSTLNKIYYTLSEQIKRGICFDCTNTPNLERCNICEKKAINCTTNFLLKIPEIRAKLSTDVEAAYIGDPAARNRGEVIFCYPSIRAMTNYRIAHELFKLEVPMIPRIITEMAHSETGIDLHPGVKIGNNFFMDHGTGIVIGETCIIGNNVRIYQGVTLGAKSFPLDSEGNPIKNIPRHPIIEDDVTIYSGATILGRIVIGKGTMVGGNVWLTNTVPENSKITQNKYNEIKFQDGSGI